MAELADRWLTETWTVTKRPPHPIEPAERRRALEGHQAAQEAKSEADAVAYRLEIRLERYQFALDDL